MEVIGSYSTLKCSSTRSGIGYHSCGAVPCSCTFEREIDRDRSQDSFNRSHLPEGRAMLRICRLIKLRNTLYHVVMRFCQKVAGMKNTGRSMRRNVMLIAVICRCHVYCMNSSCDD